MVKTLAGFDDREPIARYGESVPEQFGGVLMRDGVHVVLFTADLQRHEQALAQLLDRADFRVQLTDRSWQDLRRARDEVSDILLSPEVRQRLGVYGVGLGVEADRYRVVVSSSRSDADVAAAIIAAVAPHRVLIKQGGRPRLV